LTGENDYGEAVEQAMAADNAFRWVRGLAPGSFELAEAYRDAAPKCGRKGTQSLVLACEQ
jgi:hypothetical protein